VRGVTFTASAKETFGLVKLEAGLALLLFFFHIECNPFRDPARATIAP